MPKVSVIIPCYNSSLYLRAAIDSVLQQTFMDFDVIAINDASTDTTGIILEQYAQRDSRVRVFHNTQNLHVARTLNLGLAASDAPIIARMDSDDVAHPKRLHMQIQYLMANPHIGVLGSHARVLGTSRKITHPTNHLEIQTSLLFNSTFVHPTVMLNRDVIGDITYDEACSGVEDWDLWWRLRNRTILQNLPQVLLDYRIHPHSVTQQADPQRATLYLPQDTHHFSELGLSTHGVHFMQNLRYSILPEDISAFVQWLVYMWGVSGPDLNTNLLRKRISIRVLRLIQGTYKVQPRQVRQLMQELCRSALSF